MIETLDAPTGNEPGLSRNFSAFSFITGSHAYGTPGPHSDVDLCVMVSDADMQILDRHCDADNGSMQTTRFGKLNLICLQPSHFEAWRAATNALIARRPVTRDEAIAAIKAELKSRGL